MGHIGRRAGRVENITMLLKIEEICLLHVNKILYKKNKKEQGERSCYLSNPLKKKEIESLNACGF